MFKKRFLSIIMILVMVFSMMGFTVSAAANSYPYCAYFLYAGQNILIGSVYAERTGDTLKVGITSDSWQILEWSIDIEKLPGLIPQNSQHNPIPGKFAFKRTITSYPESYEFYIDLKSLDLDTAPVLYIAAHAVVQKVDQCAIQQETAWAGVCDGLGGEGFSGRNWATYFTYPWTAKAN